METKSNDSLELKLEFLDIENTNVEKIFKKM